MPTFSPPYPFRWGSIAQSGSPRVVDRSRPAGGTLDFFLQSNAGNPSSAHLITSYGMDIGTARAAREIVVAPTFDFDTFFYSGGTFASALTAARIAVYVEEYDGRGNFERAIDGPSMTILREDPAWWSGSRTWDPNLREAALVSPLPGVRMMARAGAFYRAFIDLHGEIRAAGFGGIGGSASIAQCQVHLRLVDAGFSSS